MSDTSATPGAFRIYVSAVSSEFRSEHEAVVYDLVAAGLEVTLQDRFRHSGDGATLLQRLNDAIRSCRAAIFLIGRQSGASPRDEEAAPFLELLPAGLRRASYAHWEFIFARHYGLQVSLYRANNGRDGMGRTVAQTADDAALQAGFVRYIESQGFQYSVFSNPDELRWTILMRASPFYKPVALPYSSLGSAFIGRDELLPQFENILATQRDADRTAVVLRGMAGTGKTRAAVEYAWTHRDDYTALLFASAQSAEYLQRDLAGLSAALKLPERFASDEWQRCEAVLRWLTAHPRWLIILDGADSPAALEAVSHVLPRMSGGDILVTSRLAETVAKAAWFQVNALPRHNAAAFLLTETEAGREKAADDAAQAQELAAELDDLPLALTLAAALIRSENLSISRYREMLKDTGAREQRPADRGVREPPRSLADACRRAMAELTAHGRHLLESLAFLAPDPVPEWLLDVAAPGASDQDARNALAELAAVSLLVRDPAQQGFRVHPVVQEVVRQTLAASDTIELRLRQTLAWIGAGFVGDPWDIRSWMRLDPLTPHAEAVVRHADAAGLGASATNLMGTLAVQFHAKALYARAEPLMRRVLAIDEADVGSDHPRVARALNNLATLLRETNRPGEAEPLLRRALYIDEASFGKDHPDVAADLNNLATLLQDTNRFGEAEPLLRRALAIDEATLGKHHPDIAIRLNNLATLLQYTNRLGEAEPLLRRALSVNEASLGNDHPNVARDLNNLAQLLRDTNRLGEAEPLMRRALAIDEASLGKDHPNVARDLNNLAALLLATNRLGEAEPSMRRALAIDEASLGKDHPNVANDLNNLATLLQATNRLGEAEPLMRRALAIVLTFQRDTGHAHPHRDAAIANYRRLLEAMGRSEADIDAALAALWREAGVALP
ncbi:MAG TPA: tetratricopeptide repeat protein [Acetobacteraceae bacterium]